MVERRLFLFFVLLISLCAIFINFANAHAEESVCGNGILETGEECDLGLWNFLCWAPYGSFCEYCTDDCKLKNITNYCGDGIKQVCEECDDGNNDSEDGCSADCKIEIPTPEEFCGDGFCNNEESCSTCEEDCGICPIGPVCGDGEVNQENETCDDGNLIDGDGCSSVCLIEEINPFCGDDVLETGEECDEGVLNGKKCDNSKSDCKYCSTTCKIIERKGDCKKSSSSGYKLVGNFCANDWDCSGWGACENGLRTRTCVDKNHCDNEYNKPAESTGCAIISNSLVKGKGGNNNFLFITIGIVMFMILLIILFNLI